MDKNQNDKNAEESTKEIEENKNGNKEVSPETETASEETTEANDQEESETETTQTTEENTRSNQAEPSRFQKLVKHVDKKVAIFSVAFLLVGLMAGSQLSGTGHRSHNAQGIDRRYDRNNQFSGHSEKTPRNREADSDWNLKEKGNFRSENRPELNGDDRSERNDSARRNRPSAEQDKNNTDKSASNQGNNNDKTDAISGASESQKSE